MTHILISIGLVLGCTELTVQAKGLTAEQPMHPGAAKPATLAKAPLAPIKEKALKSTETKVAASSPATNGLKSPSLKLTGKHEHDPSMARACSSSTHHGIAATNGRLARLTAYWASEGDYYTSHGISSTGIRLHEGHCAVDPRIIPYGSVVTIPGVGKYLAVDTGSAVISREAAREAGHTDEERNALVIDLYFESRMDGEKFEANATKYATVTWEAPNEANQMTSDVKDLIAESDWNKLRNKQL